MMTLIAVSVALAVLAFGACEFGFNPLLKACAFDSLQAEHDLIIEEMDLKEHRLAFQRAMEASVQEQLGEFRAQFYKMPVVKAPRAAGRIGL